MLRAVPHVGLHLKAISYTSRLGFLGQHNTSRSGFLGQHHTSRLGFLGQHHTHPGQDFSANITHIQVTVSRPTSHTSRSRFLSQHYTHAGQCFSLGQHRTHPGQGFSARHLVSQRVVLRAVPHHVLTCTRKPSAHFSPCLSVGHLVSQSISLTAVLYWPEAQSITHISVTVSLSAIWSVRALANFGLHFKQHVHPNQCFSVGHLTFEDVKPRAMLSMLDSPRKRYAIYKDHPCMTHNCIVWSTVRARVVGINWILMPCQARVVTYLPQDERTLL